MNYYAETNFYDHDGLVTSGGKGRDDYFEMFRRCGLERISIPVLKTSSDITIPGRISLELRLRRAWRRALKRAGRGDVFFIHHPPSEKFIGFSDQIRRVRKRGCRIVIVVFDLETYLTPYYRNQKTIKYIASMRAETDLLKLADAVIVHNERMKDKVAEMGISRDIIVPVGIMDYLIRSEPDAEDIRKRTGKDLPVVFCGNLVPDKAGFLSDIPKSLRVILYGPGLSFEPPANIDYRGIVKSEDMPDIIGGSFGLVWDGASSRTGAGVCGEYLRYNNPHKIALYLASGLPVIVWSESAMADYVRKEGCGFTVGSLNGIPGKISEMTDEEYDSMRLNAVRVGTGMRKGEHIRAAVECALSIAGKQ